MAKNPRGITRAGEPGGRAIAHRVTYNGDRGPGSHRDRRHRRGRGGGDGRSVAHVALARRPVGRGHTVAPADRRWRRAAGGPGRRGDGRARSGHHRERTPTAGRRADRCPTTATCSVGVVARIGSAAPAGGAMAQNPRALALALSHGAKSVTPGTTDAVRALRLRERKRNTGGGIHGTVAHTPLSGTAQHMAVRRPATAEAGTVLGPSPMGRPGVKAARESMR